MLIRIIGYFFTAILGIFFSTAFVNAKTFDNLTQSAINDDLYYQYNARGNLKKRIHSYYLNDSAWSHRGTVVVTKEPLFNLKHVSANRNYLFAASNSKIVRFTLDGQGQPIQSSEQLIWNSNSDDHVSVYLTKDASYFYKYSGPDKTLNLFVLEGGEYRLVEEVSANLSGTDVTIHPDGSLIYSKKLHVNYFFPPA